MLVSVTMLLYDFAAGVRNGGFDFSSNP